MSYEGRRDATAVGVTEVVPLPSLGQGDSELHVLHGIRLATMWPRPS